MFSHCIFDQISPRFSNKQFSIPISLLFKLFELFPRFPVYPSTKTIKNLTITSLNHLPAFWGRRPLIGCSPVVCEAVVSPIANGLYCILYILYCILYILYSQWAIQNQYNLNILRLKILIHLLVDFKNTT